MSTLISLTQIRMTSTRMYEIYMSGINLDKLEIAKVILLYRKDGDESFENYRPISLPSSI